MPIIPILIQFELAPGEVSSRSWDSDHRSWDSATHAWDANVLVFNGEGGAIFDGVAVFEIIKDIIGSGGALFSGFGSEVFDRFIQRWLADDAISGNWIERGSVDGEWTEDGSALGTWSEEEGPVL